MIDKTYIRGGSKVTQEKNNSQENEPKGKKHVKLISKIVVIVLFLFYVLFSFKEFF